MPERTQRSIVVAAPAAQVMSTIADVEAYPEWVAATKSVEVLETGPDKRPARARFVLDAGMVKDTFELAYTWDPDGLSVSWKLLEGQLQKSQDGRYDLHELPGGSTEVTYSLTVDLSIPMIGVFKRKAEKAITDTALQELKKRVEG